MANWNPRANEIFVRANEILLADERRAYLDQACADDADLRHVVDQLLRAHDQAGSFLDRPAIDPEQTGALPDQPTPESRTGAGRLASGRVFAGRYKLREKLGEGG